MYNMEEMIKKHTNEEGVINYEAMNAEIKQITDEHTSGIVAKNIKKTEEKKQKELEELTAQLADKSTAVDDSNDAMERVLKLEKELEETKKENKLKEINKLMLKKAEENGKDLTSAVIISNSGIELTEEIINQLPNAVIPAKGTTPINPGNEPGIDDDIDGVKKARLQRLKK